MRNINWKIIAIVVTICLIVFIFWWYEVRPLRTYNYCKKESIERVKEEAVIKIINGELEKEGIRKALNTLYELEDWFFRACLLKRGIEK